MGNTIGQAIGIIERTFSTKNDMGATAQINVRFDLSNAPDNVIKDWLGANRVIAYQSTLRKLSIDEIKALDGKTVVYDGSTRHGTRTITPERAMEVIANTAKTMSAEERKAYVEKILKQLDE